MMPMIQEFTNLAMGRFLLLFAVLIVAAGLISVTSVAHNAAFGDEHAAGVLTVHMSAVQDDCDRSADCCVSAHCASCIVALPVPVTLVVAQGPCEVAAPGGAVLWHGMPIAPERVPPRLP